MATRQAYSPGRPVVWHGMARVTKVLGGVRPIAAGDLVAGGIVLLEPLPANFVITGVDIDIPKLDNGGAPALTLNLGTPANPTLILSGSTAGQAGQANVPPLAGAKGFTIPAQTDLQLTVVVGAQVPLPASVVIYVYGHIDP